MSKETIVDKVAHMDAEHRAKELRAARARIGLSQLDVADMFGVSARSVARWEAAETFVPLEVLVELKSRVERTIALAEAVYKDVELPTTIALWYPSLEEFLNTAGREHTAETHRLWKEALARIRHDADYLEHLGVEVIFN